MSENTFKRAAADLETGISDVGKVVSSAIGMGSGPSVSVTQKTIPAKTPTVMPVRGDAASKVARRKSIAAQVARRGRASTVLTNTETLG